MNITHDNDLARSAPTVLVTGSAGHLGEALMRTLPDAGYLPIGLDIKASPFTQRVGSIVDRDFVRASVRDVSAVVHTATLHKITSPPILFWTSSIRTSRGR